MTTRDRLLALVLAGALVFSCVVLLRNSIDFGDRPTCADVELRQAKLPADDEKCYEGTSSAKTAQVVLGWVSGVLAAVAALVGLFYAHTGQRSQLLLQLTGVAILIGGASILIGAL